ncbi:uncharacterized protein [Palaemon carinicauda]|uniref:uncharacterized protein n=1 Tax=Palaemon carinicauda TaxID=392227 RepID=UPI0035B63C47
MQSSVLGWKPFAGSSCGVKLIECCSLVKRTKSFGIVKHCRISLCSARLFTELGFRLRRIFWESCRGYYQKESGTVCKLNGQVEGKTRRSKNPRKQFRKIPSNLISS